MDPPLPLPSPTSTAASSPGSATSPGGGAGSKLRLMCSYGGQIVPRPHDKTLSYTGGETRIVAVDRRTTAGSISALNAHLSRNLLGGRSFVLKYQLPNHDLDSLVSVATDEDLVNMIDEYDRLANSSTPSRLRFFLFPVAKSGSGSTDFDARSEAWFIDSLRSARIAEGEKSEAQVESEVKCGGGAVDPSPESIVLETNSSFGSSGSATSVSNIPAVKGGGGEEVGLLPVQDLKVNLPIVESPASDTSSMTGSNFPSPTLVYLDNLSPAESKDSKLASNLVDAESNASEVSPRTDIVKPVQVYSYALSQPVDRVQPKPQAQAQAQAQAQPALQTYLQPQPQYIHTGTHYPTQYYSSAMPAGAYTTTYQPYLQQQQTTYTINKPYPFYVMQAQPTDMSMQCNIAGAGPTMMVPSSMVYDTVAPAQPPAQAEVAATKAYRHKEAPSAELAQVPSVVDNVGEYEDPLHSQIYKTQPPAPAVASATVMLSDNLSQLQLESSKQVSSR